MAKTTKLHPFHETVIDAIQNVSSLEELKHLAKLIKGTKIPKNHDNIIVAWNDIERKFLGSIGNLGVTASLIRQKQEAAKKIDYNK